MAMKTPKQQAQAKLFILLGQVTSAQRWHTGMMYELVKRNLSSPALQFHYSEFVEELKMVEQDIRRKMQEIK